MVLNRKQYDVAVIGLGTMGSMALWQLAKAGVDAVGVEQFRVGHDRGGAGGESRIFRLAYKEGPEYVPLLLRSRELWLELNSRSPTPIFHPCGALTIGRPEHPDLAQVFKSIERFNLDHRVLSISEMASIYPQHRLHEGEVGIFDPAGGLLIPQQAVEAAVGAAKNHGATVLEQTEVLDIDADATGVAIATTNGTIRARRAVVAAGVWSKKLLPGRSGRFEIRRSVLHWFGTQDPALFVPGRFPVGIRRSGSDGNFSFFPTLDGSEIKCNLHIDKTAVSDPDAFDGTIDEEYSAFVRDQIIGLVQGLDPDRVRAQGYLDGYSPDNHPFFGDVPGNDNLTVLSGFSGHGFKIAPAIGEAVAEHVRFQRTTIDISHMAFNRQIDDIEDLLERNSE
ncbi:hypothetical protein AU252_06390 [Pseudarthrobacter sulfonivorans]|uniref:FAD dependent oxidoreductase domain-containing protein n=1 Tax=Pseudarthrobacter sulfonivorans TaxID=121292 RepID=A0A0U3QMN0_9MICC|nr:N-methyl-L-tryptophan oxidase [Pseudarthrobacter sulfonivorans]ALV40837.1 hypothetical protein AU252_06390 [Pseudarthrobacter sulfonivorans]